MKIITVGEYEITDYYNNEYWISNSIGEGMPIKKNVVERLLKTKNPKESVHNHFVKYF